MFYHKDNCPRKASHRRHSPERECSQHHFHRQCEHKEEVRYVILPVPGINGVDGIPGVNGVDGIPGVNGVDGINGPLPIIYHDSVTTEHAVTGTFGVPGSYIVFRYTIPQTGSYQIVTSASFRNANLQPAPIQVSYVITSNVNPLLIAPDNETLRNLTLLTTTDQSGFYNTTTSTNGIYFFSQGEVVNVTAFTGPSRSFLLERATFDAVRVSLTPPPPIQPLI
jgi:hypothetical protein